MTETCTDMTMSLANRRQVIAGAASAIVAMTSKRTWGSSKNELVLAFIPQENPEKLLVDVNQIAAWLTNTIDMPVRGFVTTDHAAAVEALRNGDADVSFMGALPYVLANQMIGAEAVLAEVYRGKSVYTGRVFVRRDSLVQKLADLKGKSIAFSDPLSESGYLYPLDLFVEQGFLRRGDGPKQFFGKIYYAGGYQQAMQAVAAGLVDAAAASQYAEFLLSAQQQREVKWIAESKPIPSHTVIVRKGLAKDVRSKFVGAMLKLNQPQYRYLLKHVYSPDGYVVATQSAYEGVRKLAAAYGLLR